MRKRKYVIDEFTSTYQLARAIQSLERKCTKSLWEGVAIGAAGTVIALSVLWLTVGGRL